MEREHGDRQDCLSHRTMRLRNPAARCPASVRLRMCRGPGGGTGNPALSYPKNARGHTHKVNVIFILRRGEIVRKSPEIERFRSNHERRTVPAGQECSAPQVMICTISRGPDIPVRRVALTKPDARKKTAESPIAIRRRVVGRKPISRPKRAPIDHASARSRAAANHVHHVLCRVLYAIYHLHKIVLTLDIRMLFPAVLGYDKAILPVPVDLAEHDFRTLRSEATFPEIRASA